MITSCETQDFVPFGRNYLHRHPGQFQIQRKRGVPVLDHGTPLIKSFKDISLHDSAKKESWVFRKHESGDEFDEELYVKGSTVVWSRGGRDNVRSVVKTFTMDTPVIQALWGSFVLSSEDHSVDSRSSMENSEGTIQNGICVAELNILSFFMESGGEYFAPLPFQVAVTWRIKNGLIFERTLTLSETSSDAKSSPISLVFSMLHPLDDIAPVMTKSSSQSGSPPKLSYVTDHNINIVFTCDNPSLAFTYDKSIGLHSIWKIRKPRQDEINQLTSSWDSSFLNVTSQTNTSFNLSSSYCHMFSNASGGGATLGSSLSFSPRRNISGRVMSPAGILRSSPNMSSMSSVRTQPQNMSASASSNIFRFQTPPNYQRSTGVHMRTPSSAHNNSNLGFENLDNYTMTTLQPNVCLEQLWTETLPPVRDGALGKASKTFLSQDMCGQQYLCYVVPYKQQMRCLKFEESNDGSQLIFGSLTSLPAKDAIPIESQNTMLVLETSGVLILYSGTTRISQVHIPVFLLSSGSQNLFRSATTPLGSPVRGEVLTSSRPPSAMDVRFGDEMNHISPVTASVDDSPCRFDLSSSGGLVTPGSSLIQNLRDNVGKKFSVELLNGSLCRTELPPMTNLSGIDLCLKAFKHLLPSNVALQVLGHWYTVRNAPGGVGNVSEWIMFTKCILGLMGYDTGKLQLTCKNDRDSSSSPLMHHKKAKPSDQGSDEDWEYLMQSDHHLHSVQTLNSLGLSDLLFPSDRKLPSLPCSINKSALLYQFCPAVFLALHMVYEEMKLNTLLYPDLHAFVPLIHQMASDLRCYNYSDLYRRDFPHLFTEIDDLSQVTEESLKDMQYPQIFPKQAPNIAAWIHEILVTGKQECSVPYIPLVCENIRKVISVYAILFNEDMSADMAVQKCLKRIASAGHRAPTAETTLNSSLFTNLRGPHSFTQGERIVLAMTDLGMTQEDLNSLPAGISLPFREACLVCRANPPSDWPKSAYILIGRQDLFELASLTASSSTTSRRRIMRSDASREEDDGMEYLDEEAEMFRYESSEGSKVLRLRFPVDLRLQEIRRMLQSARPVTISVRQRPEVSDHDFIEEQEKALLSTCIRTMALPVGRGMFTLHTCQPLVTETLPIPKLCLTGKAPPRGTTVEFTRIEVPMNMSVWPQFHNGVAAGLRIADSSEVDSAWIIYNKPKDLTSEFAGFLMALGLNGHLPALNLFNIHEYLSEGRSGSNELITIGILLGLASAKRGTMDLSVTKALSVHVSALLPATSTELNIAHNIRVAAIMGVGLLYQGTGHLHMAEIMLAEIGRPPGPEMENCIDRDSYALSAGLSLGLIMFGKGNLVTGLSDMSLADILCHLMVGGHTKPVLWPHRDRVFKAPSLLISEGDSVNVDVTSPGATLALGMIFFNTNNSAVSEWLKAPDTQVMLDQVRPDFLCLRTISHGLVNWQTVLPTVQWIDSNIPQIVKQYAFYKQKPGEDAEIDPSIDLQTMSQAYCNITAGASLVMALRFAGSTNREAFRTLLDSLHKSLKVLGDQTLVEQAGRSTVENCISVKLLAMAIVMAGSGNLVTLRICRALRRRVGPQYHQSTYGNHMCYAMATGLLCLGGGKFTFRTTPDAIGAMLCAFYPQFPLSSTDNRYHLQAFRHLYVLACEPRLVIPRDVDTGKLCYVLLKVKFKTCPAYKTVTFDTCAPYLIPELEKLEEVQVYGTRYWPIVFSENKNWETLKFVLSRGILSVKRRAGHLSFVDDPKGYRSILAKSLIADQSWPYDLELSMVKSFTSDAKISALAEFFIQTDKTDNSVMQELGAIIYQCVTQEKAEAIAPHLILRQNAQQFSESHNTLGLNQIKLVTSYYSSRYRLAYRSNIKGKLLHSEFVLSLCSCIEASLDSWLEESPYAILSYLQGQPVKWSKTNYLAQYLVWFAIPTRQAIVELGLTECPPLPILAGLFPHMSVPGVMRLHSQIVNSR